MRVSQLIFVIGCTVPLFAARPTGALPTRPGDLVAPPIAFATAGGDAWTFHKTVTVAVSGRLCDKVAFTSPLSRVTAQPRNGRAEARLTLGRGENWIAAQCRKAGAAVGPAIRQEWHVRLPDLPRAWIRSATEDGKIVLDAAASKSAPAPAAPIVKYEWRANAGNPAPLAGLPASGVRQVLTPGPVDGEYRVTLKITDARGRSDESTALFRVRHGKPELIDAADEDSEWAANAVLYGVVPKLFGRRGLADVTAQLDRLAGLGINTLWLSPITQAPHGDFGYAVTDYFHIRPSYGDDADLRHLIDAAHARGMHVVLDFVPDHLSDQHPYYLDAAAHGRRSPYYDFFARTATGAAAHYFDWRNLENLNYGNRQVQRMVIEASAYWVRKFHVDGFRVDAAWGPRQRDPGFWPHWSARLKRIDPDLLLIAEASARDPYYLKSGFDAAYDWTGKLGQWSWQQAFDDPAATASKLRAAIAASPGDHVLRFLDNNDTGRRFIARYGIGTTRVAAAMLLTLPGIPALYTGDDVGAVYQPYGSPTALSWNDPDGLEAWYARLIALRHREPALRSEALRFLDVDGSANVLAYARGSLRNGGAIVLLNFGPRPADVVLRDPLDPPGTSKLSDLLSGRTTSLAQLRSGLKLEGYDARILKPVPANSTD